MSLPSIAGSRTPSVDLVVDYVRWRQEDSHRNALERALLPVHCFTLGAAALAAALLAQPTLSSPPRVCDGTRLFLERVAATALRLASSANAYGNAGIFGSIPLAWASG
jgi:hypothetical protein